MVAVVFPWCGWPWYVVTRVSVRVNDGDSMRYCKVGLSIETGHPSYALGWHFLVSETSYSITVFRWDTCRVIPPKKGKACRESKVTRDLAVGRVGRGI